jgi:hypothetical protein
MNLSQEDYMGIKQQQLGTWEPSQHLLKDK